MQIVFSKQSLVDLPLCRVAATSVMGAAQPDTRTCVHPDTADQPSDATAEEGRRSKRRARGAPTTGQVRTTPFDAFSARTLNR